MSKNLVAKFVVQSITLDRQGNESIDAYAVIGPENEPWSKFTPSGSLKITISNPSAKGVLAPGQAFLLRIEPTEVTP